MPESKVSGPDVTWTLWGPLAQFQVTASPGATLTAGPKDLPTIETVAGAAEAVAGAAAARASEITRAGVRRGMGRNLGRWASQPPSAIRPKTAAPPAACGVSWHLSSFISG